MRRSTPNSGKSSKSASPPRFKRASAQTPTRSKNAEDIIKGNAIVVFSKSWCPYCILAKEIFSKRNLKHLAVELDLVENGADLQASLYATTGQKTVPNIFINQKHVGGYDELSQIAESGTLEDLCQGRSMEFEFDLIVIGGGSGGLAAAKEAATLGKKVALCDYVVPTPWGTKWGLGGTCVNVGCIPKKLMHRAASIRQDLNDADDFGWQGKSSESVHAWETLVGRIQGHVKSLNFGYRISLSETGVRYFNSFATFVDKHTIKLVKGAEELQATAKNFIVAVGCRPKYPSVEGARELCITSDDLFSMRTPPGRTLVIGGSYVALECAGFLVGLGFDVVVMVRSVLLRGFDRQMVDRIETHMTAYGVKFVKNCTISSIKKSEKLNGIMVEGENKGKKVFSQAFDTVLLAIGRVPNTEKLNLEPIGVRLNDETKKITVSPDDRTSVSNIFAIGDVADGVPELTPVAIQAGKFLVRRLYNFKTELVNYDFIPTTVFTPSEYACVGYSEDDAIRELGEGNVEVYHQEFKCLESVLNSSSKFHPKNYAKYITRKFDGKEVVIGAHIIAPNAGEIIQGFALAIKLGATKNDFDSLIGIHPTVAEVFTTLEISKSSGKSAAAAGC